MNDRPDERRQWAAGLKSRVALAVGVLTLGLLALLALIMWSPFIGPASPSAAGLSPGTPSATYTGYDGIANAKAPPFVEPFVPAPSEGWTAQNQAGTFRVVNVVVRAPQEMLLFYAMQTTQRGTPQVTVIARPIAPAGTPAPAKATAGLPLAVTTVQPLGTLAEFDAGLVRVAWPGQPGQFSLVVEAASPGAANASWQLTPIQEFQVNAGGGSYSTGAWAPLAIGQVSVACPCGSDGFRMALLGRSPQAVPPLNVTIDRDGQVALLSADAWTALWPTPPPFNGVVPPTEDLEHPYIAPTYPPTPTFDPNAPTWTPSLPPPPPTAPSRAP